MLKVARAIEEWGEGYAQRASYLGMPAKVTLSAIEGGWPYRCSRVPVYCSLYVDTRLMPGQSPLQVQREIERVLRQVQDSDRDLAELKLDMSVYMSQYGSECSPDEFIFQSMASAHRSVVGSDPEIISVPFFSDAAVLTRYGVPTLNYGPSGRTRHRKDAQRSSWDAEAGEHCSIEDLYTCTKVYASLILEVCNRTRQELGITP
jgi:acetylornithine deacetylase/succinyl-diaminopimelate desuccinylase-like protein